MYLQIGKDKIDISEITIHYIHYNAQSKVVSSVNNLYTESPLEPKNITDEIFNDINYALFSLPKWDIYLIPKEGDKMDYFTFKCNDKKLQKYLNLNKKIMGDNKDNKTLLLSSTKKGYRTVDLFGYYILFDEDTQLYTCKIDHFIENLYNKTYG